MTKDEFIDRARIAIHAHAYLGGESYGFDAMQTLLKEYDAFANNPTDGEDLHSLLPFHDTLSDAAYLDECAMRAMQAYTPVCFGGGLPIGEVPDVPENLFLLAARSYRVADAMLAERKRRRVGGA